MRELIDAMLEDNASKWPTGQGIKNLPEYGGSESGSRQQLELDGAGLQPAMTSARSLGGGACSMDSYVEHPAR